jgi:outer membrane protein assembly factor BamA
MGRATHILLTVLLFVSLRESCGQDVRGIPDDRLVVDGFEITGNKVTKERIITRELVFGIGDTLKKMDLLPALHRSRENLLNTTFFNFVYFDVEHLPGNHIIVQISVTERWYIWPVPILEYAERNFSEFVKNREWDKIVYGVWLKWNNFRGRGEELNAKVRLGYVNEYSLIYKVPNLGRKQQHGVITGFNMSRQNEVNVNTVNNQPLEYRPETSPAQVRMNAYAMYVYRPRLYSTHSLRLEYFSYDASDSVIHVNPFYLGYHPEYGEPLHNMQYFTLRYSFKYDTRDSRIYPLKGFKFNFLAEQFGLGWIQDYPYSMLQLTGVIMFHEELSKRFYFYNVTKGRYSTGKPLPHVMNRALGYYEFLSAYEPYVMDGSDYVISKYSLKFQLVKPTTKTIPLIGMEQFNKIHYAVYLNLFADVGYVNNTYPGPTNTLVNALHYSTGIGIDLVTYYDQVLRVDFAVNRFLEYGVFFHLETPFNRW